MSDLDNLREKVRIATIKKAEAIYGADRDNVRKRTGELTALEAQLAKHDPPEDPNDEIHLFGRLAAATSEDEVEKILVDVSMDIARASSFEDAVALLEGILPAGKLDEYMGVLEELSGVISEPENQDPTPH